MPKQGHYGQNTRPEVACDGHATGYEGHEVADHLTLRERATNKPNGVMGNVVTLGVGEISA